VAVTHVLVATDGSPGARAALRFTATLLGCAEVNRVTLLNVVQSLDSSMVNADVAMIPQVAWDELAAHANAEADNVLEQATQVFGGCIGSVTTLVRRGRRVQQILTAARELGADVIVVGSSGRSGLRGFLRVSVADAIVREAHCSVLVVRARRSNDDPGSRHR
jgi:nucleotide-binding universal stress UspA family protein